MSKKDSAVLIGHRDCFGLDQECVEYALRSLISDGIRCFYNGGMGAFDRLCARLIHNLKAEFPDIRQYLVIPYLSFHVDDAVLYDEILFPEILERKTFQSAIPARNRYMVQQASHALCYVDHRWGGAAKTYEYAVRSGCKVIQLGHYRCENTKKQSQRTC